MRVLQRSNASTEWLVVVDNKRRPLRSKHVRAGQKKPMFLATLERVDFACTNLENPLHQKSPSSVYCGVQLTYEDLDFFRSCRVRSRRRLCFRRIDTRTQQVWSHPGASCGAREGQHRLQSVV